MVQNGWIGLDTAQLVKGQAGVGFPVMSCPLTMAVRERLWPVVVNIWTDKERLGQIFVYDAQYMNKQKFHMIKILGK